MCTYLLRNCSLGEAKLAAAANAAAAADCGQILLSVAATALLAQNADRDCMLL